MSEYIVDWFGIDVQLANLYKSRTPLYLWPKRIRDERRREKIVRCRDCDYYDHWDASGPYREKHVCGHWDCLEIEPDGFCAWGERRDDA